MNLRNNLRITYVLALLLMFAETQAQKGRFSAVVNPVVIAHTGRSYGAVLQYDVTNNFRLYAGAKYHQNLLVDPVLNSQKFRYRFYADKTSQKFGYNLGLNYFFSWKYSIIKPYVYYDVTWFNMNSRTLIITDMDTSTNTFGTKLKKVTPLEYTNLLSLENNMGLGIECPFTHWLSLNMRGGIGANFILNLPGADYAGGMHTELSLQYVLGIQVNF